MSLNCDDTYFFSLLDFQIVHFCIAELNALIGLHIEIHVHNLEK